MRAMIFIGPTFYQCLIHMSEDGEIPEHRGPVHLLTRYPVFDRVKFEEMERDCLLAHGAAANLHERLFTFSDSSQMRICQTCSRVANVIQWAAGNGKIRGPYCGFCKSSENTVKINAPYGVNFSTKSCLVWAFP